MNEQKRYFNFGSLIEFDVEGKCFKYPVDFYHLYISQAPKYIKKIIHKWESGKELSGRDYYQVLNKIFSNTFNQIKTQSKGKNYSEVQGAPIPSIWGLKLENNNLVFRDEVIKEAEVKILLFCLEQFLKPYTQPILEKYLPGYKIQIINWSLKNDGSPEPIDHVIKSAYLFTLYNYLWFNEEKGYEFFIDYFSTELEKRISFINHLKELQKPGEGIEYIPVFDDFRNFDPEKGVLIAQMISRVLKRESISLEERKAIEKALFNQAKTILNFYDDHATQIRDSILTPVVSEIVSLNKSKEFLLAAETCLKNKLYNSVINRSYYGMLRAARAALVNFGYIKPWKGSSLRPAQSHEEVIQTFNQFLISDKNIFPKHFCRSLKDAFTQRLIADYADQELDEKSARSVLNKAKEFINMIEEVVS